MKFRILFPVLGLLAAAAVTFALVPAARPAAWFSGLMRRVHGVPASTPPGPPDAAPASVTFAPGVPPDSAVRDFLQAFAEATRIRDGTNLMSRLSPHYSIEGLPAGYVASDFFGQAVAKLKGVKAYVVQSIETSNRMQVVTVEFQTADGPGKIRTFKFDAEGRLLSADFFGLQRQSHGMP